MQLVIDVLPILSSTNTTEANLGHMYPKVKYIALWCLFKCGFLLCHEILFATAYNLIPGATILMVVTTVQPLPSRMSNKEMFTLPLPSGKPLSYSTEQANCNIFHSFIDQLSYRLAGVYTCTQLLVFQRAKTNTSLFKSRLWVCLFLVLGMASPDSFSCAMVLLRCFN